MKLVDHSLQSFVDVLASDAPAPGGGSTAALEGALGAALAHMVGSLTTGRAKYAEHQETVTKLLKSTDELKKTFLDVIDRDTEAFNQVSAVFSMPKETDDEKAARKAAMQAALKACTKTPHEMMELSLATLKEIKKAMGKVNTNALSDFGVAALSLKAAAQGAWLNILINVPGIQDAEFVAQYRDGGQKILTEAQTLADEIYQDVLKDLS